MNFSLIIIVFAAMVLQDTELTGLKRDVQNFDMDSRFARIFHGNLVDKFIELVPEQRKEIVEIRRDYTSKGKKVISDSSLSLEKRHSLLVKLREEQDNKIREVLLPEQLAGLESYAMYLTINDQGFAGSIVNGSLATQLELTDSERIAVNKAVGKARKEYLDAMNQAQVAAIAQFKKTLGREKARLLELQLKPLLAENGTLWKVDLKNLDSNRFSSHAISLLPHISQLEKNKKSGENK